MTRRRLASRHSNQPSAQQWQDLRFAWQVVKQAGKSNAIVANKPYAIGAGQMVMSAIIAVLKAKQMQKDLSQTVLASDAFPLPIALSKPSTQVRVV